MYSKILFKTVQQRRDISSSYKRKISIYKFKKHFHRPSMSDEIGGVIALNNIDKIILAHGFCLNDF